MAIAFFKEAKQYWPAEKRSLTVNNFAALSYLAIAAGASGEDDLGISLAMECRTLAATMNLFGVEPTDDLISDFQCLPPDQIKSLSFAAWGAFAWLTLVVITASTQDPQVDCCSYRGIYYPGEHNILPPVLPIPGDLVGPIDHESLFMWPPHPLPVYMGQTFQTFSNLWIIVQEINTKYTLTEETPINNRVPLSYAESKYQKLLDWSDSLLPGMLNGEQSPPHVLFFQ